MAKQTVKTYLAEVLQELWERIRPDMDRDIEPPFYVDDLERAAAGGLPYYQVLTNGDAAQSEELALVCAPAYPEQHRFLSAYCVDELSLRVRERLLDMGQSGAGQKGFALCTNNYEELAPRDAAQLLHGQIQATVLRHLKEAFGLDEQIINQLSVSFQEQEAVTGTVLFTVGPEENACAGFCAWGMEDKTVRFQRENIRWIGKLLTGSTPDGLWFHASDAGERPVCQGVVARSDFSGFPIRVEIEKPLVWRVFAFDQQILQYRHGWVCFPNVRDQAERHQELRRQIEAAIEEKFHLGHTEQTARLVDLVAAVSKQHHGAAAVLADWDRGQCRNRLDTLIAHQKAIRVQRGAAGSVPDIVTNAAKMDGAVLIDVKDGEVRTFAAILDGRSCTAGSPERGSRYNSIRNFTLGIRGELLAFVFSSDGGMNIIPSK